MISKIRPSAKIVKKYDEDGWHSWYAIEYFCPTCGEYIGQRYKSYNACDRCGTFYDWGAREPRIETTRAVVW